MGSAACVTRSLRTLLRVLQSTQQESRILGFGHCRSIGWRRNDLLCTKLPSLTLTAALHTGSPCCAIPPAIRVTEEPDTLYQSVAVLVKGHDRAVLDSYEFFATLAAQELGITIGKVYEPSKKIERFTLLKSVHIFKNHRVQYEIRTHYRYIELKHLTGSTADVYLEYIQRNLPEGVAMDVTKTAIEKLPDHIKEPLWSSLSMQEKPSL
ncbi:small ribosomal subunit protein uS10m isoform X2 [Lepisosteus oculatus]|uniref:small ribosomal subunit protein uS10m isoform X2 n=1 Tax=Lepisosteus oculatus TaxID=7918 RepID=UPI0007401CC1|nr:PREDICTED: 28S ribosomal protein S10, mitochondrial isoform X2 [Lepisosteus oculatus]